MGTTRFSGPVMYSGHGSDASGLGSWFKNLPINVNPDYVFLIRQHENLCLIYLCFDD